MAQSASQRRYLDSPKGKAKTKAYRQANKDKRLADSQRRRQAMRELVYQFKSVPCADCGVNYPPYVMDLDHVRGDKLMNVSALVDLGRSLKTVLAEIDKCDVVCSNCHRTRTWTRKNPGHSPENQIN